LFIVRLKICFSYLAIFVKCLIFAKKNALSYVFKFFSGQQWVLARDDKNVRLGLSSVALA